MVIGADGQQLGVMSPQQGLSIAREAGLDLVEVSPFSRPPVCRILDYSKYKYDQEKKEREARKRQHVIKLKEVRYKPNIDEHDYLTKLNHIFDFIKKGNKVKVSLMFRGRELAHTEKGQALLSRIIQDTTSISEVEKAPIREGRYFNMVLMPK
jgi:translation initiation factor IF-3